MKIRHAIIQLSSKGRLRKFNFAFWKKIGTTSISGIYTFLNMTSDSRIFPEFSDMNSDNCPNPNPNDSTHTIFSNFFMTKNRGIIPKTDEIWEWVLLIIASTCSFWALL